MSIKVPIVTYRDNPAATFWNRLGSFSTYLSPIVGFCVLFAGLPIADRHHFGTIFWIAWVALSIFAAIAFFIIVFGFCSIMESKALQKNQPPSGDTIDFTQTMEEVEKRLAASKQESESPKK